jgi:hypothetical protein
VLGIHNFRGLAALDKSLQLFLAFDKWSLAQVRAVQPQKIKGEKDGATSTVQKFFELAHTAGIEGDNLSVQNSALRSQPL